MWQPYVVTLCVALYNSPMWEHLGLRVAGDEARDLASRARVGDERRAGGGGLERGGARVVEEGELADGVALDEVGPRLGLRLGPRAGLGSWARELGSGWALWWALWWALHSALGGGVCSHRVQRGGLEEVVEGALADGHGEARRAGEDAAARGARGEGVPRLVRVGARARARVRGRGRGRGRAYHAWPRGVGRQGNVLRCAEPRLACERHTIGTAGSPRATDTPHSRRPRTHFPP
jgi:hypothetical protein